MGSAHTGTEQLVQFHRSGWPVPACHNLSTGPHSENFLPGASPSSLRVAWPTPLTQARAAKAKIRPATPTYILAGGGKQVIFLCLSPSKYLVRGTKKKNKKNSLSQVLESLIFCQTEMKNKPNLSCHRTMKCLWQFYPSR